MYEHYELWTYSGGDKEHPDSWGKQVFRQRYVGEDMSDVESRARSAYNQQTISMPKCPAKLVWVRAEDEFFGRGS